MKSIVDQSGGDKAVEKALKRLRRSLQREGVYSTVKEKARYKRPSVIKHRKNQSLKRRKVR